MVASSSTLPPHVRFTLDQYFQMGDAGVFGDARVEYIDGEIFQMSPQMNDHAFVVTACAEVLRDIFPRQKYWLRIQATLKIAGSAPEPDIAIIEGPRTRGKSYPASAILVVEVSDSTIAYDLGVKADLYAAAGITDYWVVNIPDEIVVVHRQPAANRSGKFGFRYQQIVRHHKGEKFTPLASPAEQLDPKDLLE